MQPIFVNDSASTLIQSVNANFDSEVISTDDSAADAVAALNNEFDGIDGATELSTSDSAEDFVDALNSNFELMESQGDDEQLGKFRFLHISDPHTTGSALSKCVSMMGQDESIGFTFITGDFIVPHGSLSGSATKAQLDNAKANDVPLLLVVGNHDAYDCKYAGVYDNTTSRQGATRLIRDYTDGVVFGGDDKAYWYKDIAIGSKRKLRIIGIDQYESMANWYYTGYTQAQIDWFLNLLDGMNARDYLIIAMHEPAVQNQGLDSNSRDYFAFSQAYHEGDTGKLFVTSGYRSYDNRGNEPSLNLFPRIMDAYLNKRALSMTYSNKNGSTVTINKDFTSNPCTFLFYMCGHQHCDFCQYLPDESMEYIPGTSTLVKDGGDFSNQLMCVITAAQRSVSSSTYDDLGGSGNDLGTPANPSASTLRINEYELDFDAKTIKITRHGDMNTVDGRVRDTITFPFKKTQS